MICSQRAIPFDVFVSSLPSSLLADLQSNPTFYNQRDVPWCWCCPFLINFSQYIIIIDEMPDVRTVSIDVGSSCSSDLRHIIIIIIQPNYHPFFFANSSKLTFVYVCLINIFFVWSLLLHADHVLMKFKIYESSGYDHLLISIKHTLRGLYNIDLHHTRRKNNSLTLSRDEESLAYCHAFDACECQEKDLTLVQHHIFYFF